MTKKTAEFAIEQGLELLLGKSKPTTENVSHQTCRDEFHGLLALRSVCFFLLGDKHALYSRINTFLDWYLYSSEVA